MGDRGHTRARLVAWVGGLGPRDVRAAARTAAVVAVCAAAVPVLRWVTQSPEAREGVLQTFGTFLALTALASLAWFGRSSVQVAMTVGLVFAGIVAITVLSIATEDVTFAGRIFYLLPVLFASVMLRPTGAVLVAVSAAAADAVLLVAVTSSREAFTGALHMSVALGLTAWLLTRATERQALLVSRLEALAATDSLTGLATRRVMDAHVDAIADGASGEPTSLLVLDVDAFKSINDTHGHQAGDAALQHVAEIVRQLTRPGDTVARIGGDEMAVLMPDFAYPGAQQRARHLVQTIARTPLVVGGQEVPLSVSVGVATVPDHASDTTGLLAAADAALYIAKQTGRGRVAVPAQSSPSPERRTEPTMG